MITLVAGGSPQGLSFWSAAGECSRKWHYKNQRRLLAEPPSFGSPGPEGKPNAMFVGSLFHAYGQYGMQERLTFSFDGQTPIEGYEAEEKEAWRLVCAYRKAYPDWQTPAKSEVDISLTLSESFTITGRVDALVWIEGLIDGCDHYFSPGWYIWDYKTAARKEYNFVDEYRLQMEGYIMIWNLTHPDEPVLGAVLDRITKTLKPECDRHFVPPPSEQREAHVVETWRGYHAQSKINSRNLAACVNGYKTCEYKARCWSED